jgi:hypothetical protein
VINNPDLTPCQEHGPFDDWTPRLKARGQMRCLKCGALVPRETK